jgi:RNA 2',3'-cyclic 3'-phosphodiesterase
VDDPKKKRRLFVGIALDKSVRAACAAASERLHATGFDARYEAPEKLHVTLAFLGNVDASQHEAVASALGRIAAESAPLELTLDKLGAFPHERRPRVVYVGARDQGLAYRRLAHAVRDAYGTLGFKFRDDPVAHVTIARVKDPRRPLPFIEFAPIRLPVTELSLFESIFDPRKNTSRYEIAQAAPLSS